MSTVGNLAYWLALEALTGISLEKKHQWLQRYKHPEALFSLPHAILIQFNLPQKTLDAIIDPNWASIDHALEWATQPLQHIITLDSKYYPQSLKQMTNPPLVLFVQGNPDILNTPQIAMVGSRHPTHIGQQHAQAFSAALAATGMTVTSGLAYGIDILCHKGALTSGKTIAVLGSGHNKLYPQRYKHIAQAISENGAVISEFFPDKTAHPRHFPQRNRIISGMSLGVLVIEAALKSGSLITARLALEQNREVFALPGDLHNPLAKGCHHLIKQGAKLVESIEDIIEEFPSIMGRIQKTSELPNSSKALSQEHLKILKILGASTLTVDELIQRTHYSSSQISTLILELELQGRIVSLSGGFIRMMTHTIR